MWPPPLLTYAGYGGEQFAGLAWVDYNAPVHDLGDLRGFQLTQPSGFDGNSSSSTVYLITLAKRDRFRAIVVTE